MSGKAEQLRTVSRGSTEIWNCREAYSSRVTSTNVTVLLINVGGDCMPVIRHPTIRKRVQHQKSKLVDT